MDKMAFLNKMRSVQFPPVKNLLNVAVQTARQTMPEKPNKSDYEQPNNAPPIPPRPQQNVHFDDQQQPQRMEHHEMNPFNQTSTNPFGPSGNGGSDGCGQETSFMGDYEQGYQRADNYLNRYVEFLGANSTKNV